MVLTRHCTLAYTIWSPARYQGHRCKLEQRTKPAVNHWTSMTEQVCIRLKPSNNLDIGADVRPQLKTDRALARDDDARKEPLAESHMHTNSLFHTMSNTTRGGSLRRPIHTNTTKPPGTKAP